MPATKAKDPHKSNPLYRKAVNGPYVATQKEFAARPYTVVTWEGFEISTKRFRDPKEADQWADCERRRLKIRKPRASAAK